MADMTWTGGVSGIKSLAELYLGSEPTHTAVENDFLVITLANGETIPIPLPLVSQFRQQAMPPETRLLVLPNLPRIDHVRVTNTALVVYLVDGRTLSAPLAWFPRLVHGTAAERNDYELRGEEDAIHWPALDEDISLEGLLVGGRSGESAASLQRWLGERAAVEAQPTLLSP